MAGLIFSLHFSLTFRSISWQNTSIAYSCFIESSHKVSAFNTGGALVNSEEGPTLRFLRGEVQQLLLPRVDMHDISFLTP